MTEKRKENLRIRSLKSLIATDEAAPAPRMQLGMPAAEPMPLQQASRTVEAEKRSGMLVLAPSQRISNPAAQQASPEIGAANSTTEPPMSKERMNKMAEEVILARIDALAPDKIADLVDNIVPARVNHSFEELSEVHVNRVVSNVAPVKVAEVVRDLAPDMLASAVRDMTREEVNLQLPEAMSEALEESVAHLIRQELAGDLGVSVTEKIRLLIRAEINRALSG